MDYTAIEVWTFWFIFNYDSAEHNQEQIQTTRLISGSYSGMMNVQIINTPGEKMFHSYTHMSCRGTYTRYTMTIVRGVHNYLLNVDLDYFCSVKDRLEKINKKMNSWGIV